MFDANLLIGIQKDLDLSAVPKLAILQFLIYKTPSFLNLTLPVGMALAASLVFSRLTRESELTAMRTAGASVLRVVFPVIIFGTLVAIGNFYLVDKVMPRSETNADSLERKIGVLVASPSFAQNSFIRLQNYQVSIGSLNKISQNKLVLKDILLFSRPQPGIDQIIWADSGSYNDGKWMLKNAYIRQLQGPDLIQLHVQKEFPLTDKIVVDDLFVPPAPEQLTAAQLELAIQQSRKEGLTPTALEVQLATRFSVPAACIVFAFVGPGLAIIFARNGGFAGIVLSIIIVDLYYNAYVISTQILGKNGDLPPVLAAWLPNILLGLIGIWALRRLE